MGITRELNKESLLNCYPIYINYTWFILLIITPALMSMCYKTRVWTDFGRVRVRTEIGQ